MRTLVLSMLLTACASVPGPKRPDESRRVPVNRTVPSEVAAEGEHAEASPARHGGRGGEMEWR
jgi:hypothetical protein